jgi:DNA-binding NarL/FixJ family response regulator
LSRIPALFGSFSEELMERNRKRKDISPEERKEIYEDIEKGESNEFIAEKFHVSQISVWAYKAWLTRNNTKK